MDTTLARLGELVRERRLSLGLTQAEASQRAGVSDTTWLSIEKGEPKREQTLARVCRALDWTPDSVRRILDGEEPVIRVAWQAVGGNGEVRDQLADHERRIRALEELLGSRGRRDVSAGVERALAQPPEERMPPPAEIDRRTNRAARELGLAAKGDQKAARRGGEEVSRPEPPAEQDDA